jgi:hypothetical protein
MNLFTKIVSGVDVTAVNAQLAANHDLWDEINFRRVAPGTPHSGMSDIWVRYNDVKPFVDRGDLSQLNDPHIPIWYRAWRVIPALRPIVFGLMSLVQGEMLGGILITRIPHGMGIDRHTDKSWHVSYFDKFYLSLEAGPGARFCADGEFIEPEVGDIYRFDNRVPHWVENNSGHDRVTLIVCIRTEMFTG